MPAIALDSVRAGSSTTPASSNFLRIYLTYQSVLFGIVVWDWLVCLRQEYKHVWKAKISINKVLYLMSRYVSLALTAAVFGLNYVSSDVKECNLLVRFNCAAIALTQAISLAVLTQRAYYVSLKSLVVLGVLAAFICATLVTGVIHAIFAVVGTQISTVDGFRLCRVEVPDHWKVFTGVFFALPVVGHTLATIIVCIASKRHLPHSVSLRRLLVVDGLLYLVAVDTVGMVQFLFFLLSGQRMIAMMNAAALLALTSVFCCHFILHLRAKGTQSIHTNSNSLTERPDWTNNFGKPLEEGKKGFSLGSNSIRPKLHLSRLHDTGVSYLSDTGTDRPSVSFVDNDSSDAPMIPAQVSVTEQKTFEVDTMTEEESDWVDRRASV